MKNDDNYALDDGQEQDFGGVTLQIGNSDHSLNNRYSNVDLKDTETLLNGNVKDKKGSENDNEVNEKISNIKARPNTLAIVPWAGQCAKDFFSYRDGLVGSAVDECVKEFVTSENSELIGTWLLTEVSSWDNEKERLVILSTASLIVVKYDFIALKLLDHRKVSLDDIDNLIIGELAYPSASLIRHLDGFASGISYLVKDCVYRPLQEKIAGMPSCASSTLRNTYLDPRSRSMSGIRILWNKGAPLSFAEKWNPFEKGIPFVTFISHPLLWHKEGSEVDRKMYNVDDLTAQLTKRLEEKNKSFQCTIQHKPIMIENYIGVTSLIHNKNSLGFFKVRGKFSF